MKKILFSVLLGSILLSGCGDAESRADREAEKNDEYWEAYDDGYEDGYNSGLEEGLAEKQIAIDELNDEYWPMEEEWEFYRNNAVCIDKGESVYHGYHCWNFDADDYYIFNIEYAEYMGYSPCPECFTE